MSGRRRFWLLYNVVVLSVIVVLGVTSVLGGGTRGLVLGSALVLGGCYLGVRTFRGTRAAAVPQVSDVQLGPDGVFVLSGDPERPGHAFLAWGDCAAVVASPLPDGRGAYYVHFMPTRADAVVLTDVPGSLLRGKATLVDLPLTDAVAMVWVGSEAALPRMLAVLDEVRRGRPELRVVDSIRRRPTSG